MKSLSVSAIILTAALFAIQAPGSLASQGPQLLGSAGTGLAPDYEGSKHYRPIPLLLLRAEWPSGRSFFFRGTGLEANLLENGRWQAGPVVRYRFSRKDVDNSRVDRLRRVDAGLEMGAFVGLSSGAWGLKFTAVQDVADGHDGALAEVAGSYMRPLGQKGILTLSLAATLADSNYMETYFSIDEDNALRSGLQTFQAGAGLKDVGAGLLYNRGLAGRWGVSGLLRYSRLLGDAADSPLVKEGAADQVVFGLLASYRF
jgi:MipA family protein